MGYRCSRLLACTVTLMLLLTLAVVLVGCGSSGGGGGSGVAVSMMKKLPEDAEGFNFIDVSAFRTDKDLDEAYESLMDDLESELEVLGISVDDVDRMARGGDVTILEGSFDLADVRDELEDSGYEDDEYKDVETWEGELSVALVSGSCIITGYYVESVEGCIDVINSGADSLYDDTDLQGVMDRLSSGIWVYAYPAYEGYEEYEGLEVTGYSLAKKDADSMRATAIYLFEDKDAASAAVDDIEEEMEEEEDVTNIVVKQDGEYVKASGDGEIEEIFSDDGDD